MTVRLENLTSRPVTVVLNSGAVVHLPPGHAVEPDPVEIQDNAKVQKLRDALVIAVAEMDDAAPDGGADQAQAVPDAAEQPPAQRQRRRADAGGRAADEQQ